MLMLDPWLALVCPEADFGTTEKVRYFLRSHRPAPVYRLTVLQCASCLSEHENGLVLKTGRTSVVCRRRSTTRAIQPGPRKRRRISNYGLSQPVETVLIKWISAILLICLAAFIARPWVSRLFNRTEIFNVCQGPDKLGCNASDHFISCETDVSEWLKSIRPDVCVRVDAKKVSAVPATQCGYTNYEVKCSRR